MEKYFVLTVPKGSTVHTATSSKVITGVPEDAFEKLLAGCTWIVLKADASDFLKKQPKEKLSALLRMRKKQGFKSDVEIIEKALAEYDEKPSKKDKEAEPAKPSGK